MRKSVVVPALLISGLLFLLTGCADPASGEDSLVLGATDLASTTGADASGEPPPGPHHPPLCETQADCETDAGCPADAAKGCACTAAPNGKSVCIPRCETLDDCPLPPVRTPVCASGGVCQPPRGAHRGANRGGEGRPRPPKTACQSQTDCDQEGACPMGEGLGCVCATLPDGESRCVPSCETAADCPLPPVPQMACSSEGLCTPPRPPRPADGRR